jgi:hypothetical protein
MISLLVRISGGPFERREEYRAAQVAVYLFEKNIQLQRRELQLTVKISP